MEKNSFLKITVVGISVFVMTSYAKDKEISAETLINKSVQALHVKQEDSIYTMRLLDKEGKEEGKRKMRVWFKSQTDDDAKLMIKFMEPANIRGTGLLTILEKSKDPDQWLYLPAYKKIRRVKSGNESESFLGTDFTMADISVQRESNFEYKIQGTEKCGQNDCYVLIGVPKPDVDKDTLSYSRKKLLIRKDNHLNIRTEFYSTEDLQKIEKVMTLHGIQKDKADKWLVNKIEMKNETTHHSTVLEFDKRDISKTPADQFFTQSFLEKGV